eukprot:862265_1
MADKFEFNPRARSIFIGLLLLVVLLVIGSMLSKGSGTGTDRGITKFQMFTSPKKVKIQFKDSKCADVKKYSFTAVFKSDDDKLFNDPVSISTKGLVGGDRKGGESAQKEFIWNRNKSTAILLALKQRHITEILVHKHLNNKTTQVAVVGAADIKFQADDNMILVD